MEIYVIPAMAFLGGAYFLWRNLRLFRNEELLKHDLSTNPKAEFWVQKLGFEKTLNLTKKVFLPLGLLVSAGMFSVGVWGLLAILRVQ